MLLHRFCSLQEFLRYLAGLTLRNNTDHFHFGSGGSISRGFCFFEGSPEEWAHRLNGIVTFDVLLSVEVDPSLVRKSSGVYAHYPYDPVGPAVRRLFTEYCTESYSKADFKLRAADYSYPRRFISLGENPFINH